jgi:hypothetical protein
LNSARNQSKIIPVCIAVVGIIATLYFYETDLRGHVPLAPIAGAISLLIVAITSGVVTARKSGRNSNKLLIGINRLLFVVSLIGAAYLWLFII